MAKAKTAHMTQREKFIEAARKHGASEDATDWDRALVGVAKAPSAKAKKAAKKRKR